MDFQYDDDHKKLLDGCDRLRAKFAGLYAKILTEHPDIELVKENTRVDDLKVDLNVLLKEQKLLKNFECNIKYGKYDNELLMLQQLTKGLILAYKSVRTTIRWEKGEMNE